MTWQQCSRPTLELEFAGRPGYSISMVRPPAPRDLPPRSSENEKRALSADPPSACEITALTNTAAYEGYGKHKRNPHIWKLAVFHGYAPDRTFCEDAGFTIGDKPRILSLLARGIAAGLFGGYQQNGVPTKLWTIDDNGWIYEFAITNAYTPLYHGYPIRHSDAMARKVIDRFEQYVLTLPALSAWRPALVIALRAAQDSYS